MTKKNDTFSAEAFDSGNRAFSKSPDNFTHVDGYITARSKYRPARILRNGEAWQVSRPQDMRPILMMWRPDLDTSIDYVNFAIKRNIIKATPVTFESRSSVIKGLECDVQIALEKMYVKQGKESVEKYIVDFLATQSKWNSKSELPGNDHLQGGALLFGNNKLTPGANSKWRLLNRSPYNQDGSKSNDELDGFDLLLAADVDNSNPIVQAEQLNWLHYLLNFGSITANDPDANFDGIRVDAVDNVDADLLQILEDYMRCKFKFGRNDFITNQHLTITEDWSGNDPQYLSDHGNPQITIDGKFQQQARASLMAHNDRSAMKRFMEWGTPQLVESKIGALAQPNYTFIRAHDSEVQDIIFNILRDTRPDIERPVAAPWADIQEAFKIYNEDMLSSNKKYTQDNIPACYALLLTNKDTMPRVYYGDLFTDDGQFMAKKSPYYDAIDALLRARKQLCGGGQTLTITGEDILVSTRFGEGISEPDSFLKSSQDKGMAVVCHNRQFLTPSNDAYINFGKSHPNQKFRALIDTTDDGLKVYLDGKDAPTVTTTEFGFATIPAAKMKGQQKHDISGYLSVWIPADVDLYNSPTVMTGDGAVRGDGQYFHANAEFDKNVMLEIFSNFQEFPTKREEFANVIMAEKADLFVEWGITSVQLPPQYRNCGDESFLDAVGANGYAFTDRYDLGANGVPTKYGTEEDLRNLIKALHKRNLQVVADFVPDQLYNLPKQEIVSVTRADAKGLRIPGGFENVLYAAWVRGGGEMQKKYGGEFLEEIREKYPEIFERKQVSTGVPIDPSVKIKEWSAKYFNGCAIQGLGVSFVLQDTNGKYFRVGDETYLPAEVIGE